MRAEASPVPSGGREQPLDSWVEKKGLGASHTRHTLPAFVRHSDSLQSVTAGESWEWQHTPQPDSGARSVATTRPFTSPPPEILPLPRNLLQRRSRRLLPYDPPFTHLPMSFPAPTAASTSHRATLAYQTAKLSTRTGTAPPAFVRPTPTPARVFAPRRPAECGRNRTPTRVRVLRSAVCADPAALKETLNVGDQDVRKRERLLVANRVRAACVWERSLTPRNSQGRTLSRPHIAAAVASVSYYHRLHFHRSATLACKAARL